MVNRVPIQPKLFGAYSTRHTFRFVHRKTSAISRSRFNEGREGRSCLSSVLLFARSKRCQSFYFLSFSPPFSLLSLSIPCMSRKSRKFTLEGASSNRVSRRTSPPLVSRALHLPERARSRSGVGNLRATDFAPRLPFGPKEVEGRSSVRCGSRYLD